MINPQREKILFNRFERYGRLFIVGFILFLFGSIELGLSAFQLLRYKNETKPYYVAFFLRPFVKIFVKEDFIPRTLSMYEWPWDYKTDRARPGRYINKINPNYPRYTINSFGVRGKEFQIPKPEGIFRVVVYGGSTTFGSESADDQTSPASLEKILRERIGKENIEVINYGAHSKGLYWVAQQYFKEVDNIAPDIVIINTIRNTFAEQLQKYALYSDIVTPQKAKILKVHLFLTDYWLFYRFIRRSWENYVFNKTVSRTPKDNAEERVLAYTDGVSRNPDPTFFNILYPKMIESIYLDAKRRNARLMVIIEPIRCRGQKGGFTCGFGDYKDDVPFYYESFRQALVKLKNKYSDIIVLDPVEEMLQIADQFADPVAIFLDPIHLSPLGNFKLAERIADKIVEGQLIK